MNDEKYTELERLSQQRLRVTQRAATRLFSLHDQLERLHRGLYNKAADKVVNMALISYEGDKAAYANMTAPEIFQDLIARKWQDALAQGKGTTEDNDE